MRKTKNWLIPLLLILFTGYYAGITLFPHVHEVDGQRIVHSHPYSGQSSQPGHQHSAQQFQWIQLLCSLFLLSLLSGLLMSPLSGFRRISYAFHQAGTALQHGLCCQLRGPPAV